MNRPIRRVAVVAAVMILALLANITFLQTRAGSLSADMNNRRVRDAEFAQNRGAIMVGNTAVAYSKPSTGQFGYQRVYPNPQMYAAVTGYYSYEYGRVGLESVYNTQLAGTADDQMLNRLVGLMSGKPPRGANVQTTIDPRAQQAAYDGLKGKKGAAVAIDYRTGAILAFVSTPSYDPNGVSNNDLGKANEAWRILLKDSNKPINNRASSEIYPPGSTFKLVTAAAALQNGMTADSLVKSPAQLQLPQSSHNLTNEEDCGGDQVTITQALAVSCNTAFANLGLQLGQEKLRAQAEAFGFNAPLGSDVPYVKSRFPGSLTPPQLALSAIGQQDIAASPLQMAMVVSTIANGGQGMQPYLVQEVRSADLQVLSSHVPTKTKQAVSTQTAQQLQQMMVKVVTDGTGQAAQVPDVLVGGKTGTAQTAANRSPYAWFVCFADDPHIAIAVFVEDANIERSEVAGGRVAAPIAKSIIEAMK